MGGLDLRFSLAGLDLTVVDGRRAPEICEELDRACFDDQGRLQVMPASYYERWPQAELGLWCNKRGLYFLPTHESVAFARALLPDDLSQALEIGSGNGCLGRALGIRCTDNRQQERPLVAADYAMKGWQTVTYGTDVETATALEAVERYKPQVVVAAWVTHRFDPKRPKLFGNASGVDEIKLIGKPWVKRYVFFGHETAHRYKPVLGRVHQTWTPAGLYSRAMHEGRNVVWVWER